MKFYLPIRYFLLILQYGLLLNKAVYNTRILYYTELSSVNSLNFHFWQKNSLYVLYFPFCLTHSNYFGVC